jgi:3-hydroxy-3-methylglutaryl CoA synthase
MARARKYANAAEKAKAFRLRQKAKKEMIAPELHALARAIHRIYEQRAAADIDDAAQMVGKTPFETLVRVVLADILWNQHTTDDISPVFPGWHELIKPLMESAESNPAYLCNGGDAVGGIVYLSLKDALDEEKEEAGQEKCAG